MDEWRYPPGDMPVSGTLKAGILDSGEITAVRWDDRSNLWVTASGLRLGVRAWTDLPERMEEAVHDYYRY